MIFFLLLSSLGKVILSWPHAVCEQRWRLADTGTELAEISLEALCASFFLFFVLFCFVGHIRRSELFGVFNF